MDARSTAEDSDKGKQPFSTGLEADEETDGHSSKSNEFLVEEVEPENEGGRQVAPIGDDDQFSTSKKNTAPEDNNNENSTSFNVIEAPKDVQHTKHTQKPHSEMDNDSDESAVANTATTILDKSVTTISVICTSKSAPVLNVPQISPFSPTPSFVISPLEGETLLNPVINNHNLFNNNLSESNTRKEPTAVNSTSSTATLTCSNLNLDLNSSFQPVQSASTANTFIDQTGAHLISSTANSAAQNVVSNSFGNQIFSSISFQKQFLSNIETALPSYSNENVVAGGKRKLAMTSTPKFSDLSLLRALQANTKFLLNSLITFKKDMLQMPKEVDNEKLSNEKIRIIDNEDELKSNVCSNSDKENENQKNKKDSIVGNHSIPKITLPIQSLGNEQILQEPLGRSALSIAKPLPPPPLTTTIVRVDTDLPDKSTLLSQEVAKLKQPVEPPHSQAELMLIPFQQGSTSVAASADQPNRAVKLKSNQIKTAQAMAVRFGVMKTTTTATELSVPLPLSSNSKDLSEYFLYNTAFSEAFRFFTPSHSLSNCTILLCVNQLTGRVHLCSSQGNLSADLDLEISQHVKYVIWREVGCLSAEEEEEQLQQHFGSIPKYTQKVVEHHAAFKRCIREEDFNRLKEVFRNTETGRSSSKNGEPVKSERRFLCPFAAGDHCKLWSFTTR